MTVESFALCDVVNDGHRCDSRSPVHGLGGGLLPAGWSMVTSMVSMDVQVGRAERLSPLATPPIRKLLDLVRDAVASKPSEQAEALRMILATMSSVAADVGGHTGLMMQDLVKQAGTLLLEMSGDAIPKKIDEMMAKLEAAFAPDAPPSEGDVIAGGDDGFVDVFPPIMRQRVSLVCDKHAMHTFADPHPPSYQGQPFPCGPLG